MQALLSEIYRQALKTDRRARSSFRSVGVDSNFCSLILVSSLFVLFDPSTRHPLVLIWEFKFLRQSQHRSPAIWGRFSIQVCKVPVWIRTALNDISALLDQVLNAFKIAHAAYTCSASA